MSVTELEKSQLMECFVETKSEFTKALTLMTIIYGSALILFLR